MHGTDIFGAGADDAVCVVDPAGRVRFHRAVVVEHLGLGLAERVAEAKKIGYSIGVQATVSIQ